MLAKLIIGNDYDYLLSKALRYWAGKDINWLNNPDVHLLPETLAGVSSIGVGEVRALTKALHLKPMHSEFKLAVIRAAELLTIEAQNALLKLLEEPPNDVQLILISKQENALLPTVLSRVVVEIENQKLNIENQISNKKETDKFLELLVMEPSARLAQTSELAKTREAAVELVKVWLQVGHGWITGRNAETLRATSLRDTDLIKMLKTLQQAQKYLQANTHAQLTMDWILLKLPKMKVVK